MLLFAAAGATIVDDGGSTTYFAATPLAFDLTADALKQIEGDLSEGTYLVGVKGLNDVDIYLFERDGMGLIAVGDRPAPEPEIIEGPLPPRDYLLGVDLLLGPGATGGAEAYTLRVP